MEKLLKIFIIIYFFISSSSAVFAQENNKDFKESDLPDKSQKTDTKKSDMSNSTLNSIANSKNDLVNTLLGNKPISLMLDDDEMSKVQSAIEVLKTNKASQDSQTSDKSDSSASDSELSDADRANIGDDERKPTSNQRSGKAYLYLASIIYFTPQDWAVWINSKKVTYSTNKKDNEIYIKYIKQDTARIIWTMSLSKWKIISGNQNESLAPKINSNNQVELEFELRPNQTFVMTSDAVVEGRAVLNMLKKDKVDKKSNTKSSSGKVQVEDLNNTMATPPMNPPANKIDNNRTN